MSINPIISTMRLYEIDAALESCYRDATDPDTGEISADAEAMFDALTIARETKIVDTVSLLKSLAAERSAIEAESIALSNRAESIGKRIEWLRQYVAQRMTPGEKVETARVRVSCYETSAVELTDPGLIPGDLCVQKTTVTASKTKVREAIEAGRDVPGAKIVTNRNLRIK